VGTLAAIWSFVIRKLVQLTRYLFSLAFIEALALILVLIAVGSVVVLEFLWVARAPSLDAKQVRLVEVIRLMNENWKVGLLILIPLFYRPVRTFLEELREAFGMKRTPREVSEETTEEPD
jgi:hypothetical protein